MWMLDIRLGRQQRRRGGQVLWPRVGHQGVAAIAQPVEEGAAIISELRVLCEINRRPPQGRRGQLPLRDGARPLAWPIFVRRPGAGDGFGILMRAAVPPPPPRARRPQAEQGPRQGHEARPKLVGVMSSRRLATSASCPVEVRLRRLPRTISRQGGRRRPPQPRRGRFAASADARPRSSWSALCAAADSLAAETGLQAACSVSCRWLRCPRLPKALACMIG